MDTYSQYMEISDRPEDIFPLFIYKLYGRKGLFVPLHWHDEIEIIYPTVSGVLLLNGQKIIFEENNILFIKSKQMHSTILDCDGLVYHIMFKPSLFDISFGACHINTIPDLPEIITYKHSPLRSLLEELIKMPTPVSSDNILQVMNNLYKMFTVILDYEHKPITTTDASSIQSCYIQSAINYIKKNIHNKISVIEISDEIGISKAYFMRLFKSFTGETVISYIQNYRLEAAKNDLLAGRSITDISYDYSFYDTAYFCKLFKEKYGCSPLKYKKQTVSDL